MIKAAGPDGCGAALGRPSIWAAGSARTQYRSPPRGELVVGAQIVGTDPQPSGHVPATHVHQRGLRRGHQGVRLGGQLGITADELPDTPGELLVVGHGHDRSDRRSRGRESRRRASLVNAALGHVRRSPHLRLCCLLPALVSPLFAPLCPLLPILLPLILALGSCILILLRDPSDQCTSERARSIKIMRECGYGRDGDDRQGL